MNLVTLSDLWREHAIKVGTRRFNVSVERNYVNYGAVEGAQLIFNVNGAVAECAVAAYFRLLWNWSAPLGSIDVGKIIEVRGRRPFSDLGIRPANKDKHRLPHVLAWVNEDYSVEMRGWLFGYEGAHEPGSEAHRQRWNEFSGCWYNPPPYRPLEELSAILANDDEVERIFQEHMADEARKEAERLAAARVAV